MRSLRGMSFMDVIIGTALVLTVFIALSGLLRSSLVVASLAKSKLVATGVAESQMEYVRSLSYDAVGTVGGIPAGNIPQYATTTSNGMTLVTRTYIEYMDDPADGLEINDSNGITTDYKRIKVSVAYTANKVPHTVELVSNYAPPGIETTSGGGTLRINVVNAAGMPVSGASVRVENPATNPTVDVTTFSDANGIVYLPGAATSTDYRITVSKSGYSNSQTYERNAINQNPTPGYLTVVENQTTTSTFAIDVLTTLVLHTFSPIATTTWSDSFENASKLATQNNTVVSGGSITLASNGFGYVPSGTVYSVGIEPDYLAGWSSAEMSTALPGGTSVRLQVIDRSGMLLPDAVLPGNSIGFSGSVDLYGVNKTAYPVLALLATFETNSVAATPSLLDWTVTYRRGPVPLPNIALTLTGAKTIGSTGAGDPLYKTTVSTVTDSNGERTLSLEWDEYQIELSSHDIVDACNAPPYTLAPAGSIDSSLILDDVTANMLLVSAYAAGAPIEGASVTLERPGYSRTVVTSACGAAYFGGLSGASDYSITATTPGYNVFTAAGVTVSGKSFYEALFE